MNLGALAASLRLYVRWYRCGCTVRKTYSLDQCSHSLTLRTQQRSVLTTITRWHTRCEPSALSASHSSRRRLLALFLLPPLLFPSRNSWLCFCFRLPFGGKWMISTELRFSSSSSLRDTTDRRGVARGRAHHDGEQREGVLFFKFNFIFFIYFILEGRRCNFKQRK